MNLILSVLASLCLLLCQPAAVPSAARPEQQPGIHPADNPFFTQPEIVELSFSLPLAKILSDRGASPRLHPATISYQDAGPTTKTVAVQVQVRGNRRKDPTVCGFPPLLVKFPPEATHGTLFGPVTELKLTTHCLSDTYTLREYLVYKLFNVLTDVSYRTRLCRITYRDNSGKDNATVRYAFFWKVRRCWPCAAKPRWYQKNYSSAWKMSTRRPWRRWPFFNTWWATRIGPFPSGTTSGC